MTAQEQEALLTLCLLAAFADGSLSDSERATLKRVMDTQPAAGANTAAVYQRVLLRQVTPAQAASQLASPEARQLAYEMAVGVCDADDALNEAEKAFLTGLRGELRLDAPAAAGIEQAADALAASPLAGALDFPPETPATVPAPPAAAADAELDGMILKYAILNGALELMPESLATMAIIPLQMKLVYAVGKRHGYALDRGHIKELLAAAGVGLTSQVVEGYARKLLGGLLGSLGGGLMRGLGKQAASSAMSFASTYALGHLAKQYYAGGRTLSALQLRDLFSRLSEQARGLHGQYAGQIERQAGQTRLSQLLPLIRQG